MTDMPKALLIVEGGKDETEFFKQYQVAYALDFEIFCFRTNIYSLYAELQKYDFNADIKTILGLRCPEYKSALNQKFAYTYLVFDLDAHHPKKDETRTLLDIYKDNIAKAHEMAKYFVNETDPTIGRLYINYPMFESFRACYSFDDESYQNEKVSLLEAASFKQHAGTKKLSSLHISAYTAENFNSLSRLNVCKLNQLIFGHWGIMNYSDYIKQSGTDNILSHEETCVSTENAIQVLNTSLFIALDYYGNKKRWYDLFINCYEAD